MALSLVILGLSSCSENDEPNGGNETISGKYALAGKVEKGPFVRGSSISVQPLNANLTSTGSVFNGEISDDAGNFDLGKVELASQYVRLSTDGYYFNEVNGNLSQGTLHLVAYADLTDRTTVNVNILTHLKSARVQKLVTSGKSFAEADQQAQKELLTQFALQDLANKAVETFSITSNTREAAALIAVSSLVLANRSEAEITQYLSVLSQDLADDGSFTEANKTKINEDQAYIASKLDEISHNIESRYEDLGQTITVPNLMSVFDWDGDGIAGNENLDNPQVTLSQSEVTFDKEGGEIDIQVSSNMKLSLTPQNSSPTIINPVSWLNWYDDKGKSITIEKSLANNVLHIKVEKSEKSYSQDATINLYDVFDNVQASVRVSLTGDPSIKLELSAQAQELVRNVYDIFTESQSWSYYVERGYTGLTNWNNVSCPLSPNDEYLSRAYQTSYQSIARCVEISYHLDNQNLYVPSAFFKLLSAISHADLANKWGYIIIRREPNEFNAVQSSKEEALAYANSLLDAISDYFPEGKTAILPTNANEIYALTKDVWRAAKAHVLMLQGHYSSAATLLQQIENGNRYKLNSENEYDETNDAAILMFLVNNQVAAGHKLPLFTYTDALLSLAECKYHLGNANQAKSLVNKVASAKNISVSGDVIADINTIRRKLLMPHYFEFQKRNNLGGYQSYQLLWPFPNGEVILGLRQNPGY